MKTEGVKTSETKPVAPAEKVKTEKSAFDKLLRNKSTEIPEANPAAGAIPLALPNLQMAPVMKKDETPGPASSRLLDNLSAEIVTTLNTKDIKEVQIQFDSKTLAGLQVTIRSEQGKLVVKMQAGNSEVANLLERNTTGLVERLAERGYAGAEVRVDRSPKVQAATQAKTQAKPPALPFKRGPR
jgi:flagellar hook-length control protein FliK